MKGGFFFKINQKQIDNWGKDYRCIPDQSQIDCGAMVLSFLGIPFNLARELQKLSSEQGEITINDMLKAMNMLDSKEFENAPNIDSKLIKKMNSLQELEQFIRLNVPNKYSIIVLGRRKELPFEGASTRGHFFIMYKNQVGNIFILDPQNYQLLTEAKDIDKYLSNYDDGAYILVGKTNDGKFTKINTLYKEPISVNRRRFTLESSLLPAKQSKFNGGKKSKKSKKSKK